MLVASVGVKSVYQLCRILTNARRPEVKERDIRFNIHRIYNVEFDSLEINAAQSNSHQNLDIAKALPNAVIMEVVVTSIFEA